MFGIALASFLTQTHTPRTLLVCIRDDPDPYVDVLLRMAHQWIQPPRAQHDPWTREHRAPTSGVGIVLLRPGGDRRRDSDSPCEDLDVSIRELLDHGRDIVTIWDDDDYSPPDRLEQTSLAYERTPQVARASAVYGYSSGYFCNLLTGWGHEVVVWSDGHLWGGSLAFDRRAFERAGGFAHRSPVGYDREFSRSLTLYSLPGASHESAGPVAFVHGKNIATKLQARGALLDLSRAPARVQAEIALARRFLIDRRVHVQQPED